MNPSAREIVESRVWREMVEKTRESIRNEWEASDPKDVDKIQDLSYRQRALREIISHLEREFRGSINLHD